MPTPSAKQLRIFLKRQGVDKFGADYEPCIRATRAEAPRSSRPAILRPKSLAREVHVLSQPELAATILALFHNRLFDLHEQRMLSTSPRPHPLAMHPFAKGLSLPSMRGTVKVAEDLGILKRHTTISWTSTQGKSAVPYPYIGDLLLFLLDDDGPYCVNWSVKRSQKDFELPDLKMRAKKRPHQVQSDALNRLAIEVEYYRDGDIRTVRVAEEDLDSTLISNLVRAFCWSTRDTQLDPIQDRRLVDRFNDALYLKVSPLEVILEATRKLGYQREQCICVFNQAIWHKKLPVDLFKPVLIDHPLNPERVGVISRYSSWFERRPQ